MHQNSACSSLLYSSVLWGLQEVVSENICIFMQLVWTDPFISRATVHSLFSPHAPSHDRIFLTHGRNLPLHCASLAPVEGSGAAAVLCVGKSQVKRGEPLCSHTSASTLIHRRGGSQFVWKSSLYSTLTLVLIYCSSALGWGVEAAVVTYHRPHSMAARVGWNHA